MKKLSITHKFFYGFGFASRGIRNGLFTLFVFFYFNQVLGLDAKLAGLSSLIALVFDSISDPLVGVFSDKWSSKKWGRRHPFMFASALPLGLFTYLLFAPPAHLNEMELFWWLTGFSILLRTTHTFFVIPAISLGAELSTDYKERTTIPAIRILFDASFSPIVMIIGYTLYFVPTEDYSNGLLNKAAYPSFALLCAIVMVLTIFISTWGTRHLIPHLPKASTNQNQLSTIQLLSSLGNAIKMPSFLSLVLLSMFLFVSLGVGIVFFPYLCPYYFGFTLPCNLRILGFFPENDSPYLLITFIAFLMVGYAFTWISLSLASSMMADVVDEFELLSGKRQEGLFFSVMSFAEKTTTGIGSFIAGLLLSWIAFPTQTDIADIPAAAIDGLGLVCGPILLGFYLFSVIFIFFYPITKERYQEIRAVLDTPTTNFG